MVTADLVVAISTLGTVVLLAGVLNGVAGFGFALLGTMALATILEPSRAVVFLILPILSVNTSLLRDLSRRDLYRCWGRFRPLLLAALLGTVIGMTVLENLPAEPLRVSLGLITLAYVLAAQSVVSIPGRTAVEERCFVENIPAMVGIGAGSGLLFGGTNVGVQLIAYLRSCDLSHETFIGVVAMVFFGLNSVRVAVAAALGLYPDLPFALTSLGAVVPAIGGVAIGKRLRPLVAAEYRRAVVLGLLTIVGLRLVQTAV